MKAASALCTAVVACALASCGGGGGVVPAQVEDDIRSRLGEQTGATIETVTCPRDIPSEPGESFVCTAFVRSGSALEVPVTIVAGGSFEWSFEGRARDGKAIAANVAEQMRKDFGDPGLQVTCPESVVVADGESVECRAVDSEGLEADVTVTVDGDSVTYEVVAD